jgi:hypothetical protein
MIKLKDLLNEGKTGNDFIDFLLTKIQPTINDIITLRKQKAEKEGERFSAFEEHLTELTLKYDLLKALGIYTKSGDKMIDGKVSNSGKGALTIHAIIDRDGERFHLNTDVIYAGGYNIQKLHFRYLTKTNLSRAASNPEADKLKAELSKLSKGDKLRKEIEDYEKWIKINTEKAEQNSKFSDKEIYKLLLKDDPSVSKKSAAPVPLKIYTWDDIVKNGEAHNYNNSKAEFEKKNKQYIDSKITFWKKLNIEFRFDSIKNQKIEKERLEKKLDALV